jgi:hypothetical protein
MINKEVFITWLVKRGFIEEPDSNTKQVFCILYPPTMAD